MKNPKTQDEYIDHILEYDPEVVATASIFSRAQSQLLLPKNLSPIPWPANCAPKPQPFQTKPNASDPLPECDYLIITRTVAEALALSDILTPGYRSKTDWYFYTHLFNTDYKPILKGGAPSLKSKRLGSWFITKIGSKTAMCFKSELHLARDGSKLPVRLLWKQLINEVKPKLVITTGTAGAVGKNIQLGDVVVSRNARFDCNRTFKNQPFNNKVFTSPISIPTKNFNIANSKLLPVNADKLPQAARAPKIIYKTSSAIKKIDVVTTDFFAYDNTTNTFQLQSLGSAVEMGDALLGLACADLGAAAPPYLAVRNASVHKLMAHSQQKIKYKWLHASMKSMATGLPWRAQLHAGL